MIFNGENKSPDADKTKEHWFLESVLFCFLQGGTRLLLA